MAFADVPLRLAGDHPAFAGHFPDFPLAPGALLLSLVADAVTAQGWPPAAKLTRVKFHAPVRPETSYMLRGDEGADGGALKLTLSDAAGALVLSLTYLVAADGRTP